LRVSRSAERWSRTHDRSAATEPARRGLRAEFEREADPDGAVDDPAERARRADALITANMLRLARASARARRRKAERNSSQAVGGAHDRSEGLVSERPVGSAHRAGRGVLLINQRNGVSTEVALLRSFAEGDFTLAELIGADLARMTDISNL
jgi:hypothetical protein